MEIQPDQEWLSPTDLGKLLGLGKTKVYELTQTEIPTYRIGRVIRVHRKDIETWLETNRVSPSSQQALHKTGDYEYEQDNRMRR